MCLLHSTPPPGSSKRAAQAKTGLASWGQDEWLLAGAFGAIAVLIAVAGSLFYYIVPSMS